MNIEQTEKVLEALRLLSTAKRKCEEFIFSTTPELVSDQQKTEAVENYIEALANLEEALGMVSDSFDKHSEITMKVERVEKRED